MKKALLRALAFYQRWVSPLTAPSCRFQPTCSSYFIEAVERHGVVSGLRLGITRLLKCHPFHSGGYDPCPVDTERSAVPVQGDACHDHKADCTNHRITRT